MLFYSGDSLNSSLVAVVAVEPDVLKEWSASEGIEVDLVSISNRSEFGYITSF